MRSPRIHIKQQVGLALALIMLMSVVVLLGQFWNRPAPSAFTDKALSTDLAGRSASRSTTSQLDQLTQARVEEAYGKLPLSFIENRGQVDDSVAYYIQGNDKTIYFTSEGLTFALTGKGKRQTAPEATAHGASLRPVTFAAEPDQEQEDAKQRWALKLDFVGAKRGVRPTGQDLTPAVVSYFKGPREQWQTGLKTYATLVYRDLWPGIDLIYSGTVNQLKYTFVVKPGADPKQIKLAYRGATAVRLTEAGQLEVTTPVGGFHDEKPYSYQEVEGQRVEVTTAYALQANAAAGAQVYGFRVGVYDSSKALVLDPAVLVYAGYIGGGGGESGNSIAVDSAGNAYVTGLAGSFGAPFPVTVGPDSTSNGSNDAFVAKVNAAGTALIYAGYIGGLSGDEGNGIAVDSDGNAYITGTTRSNEDSFPVTVGPDLTFNGSADSFSGRDAFVAKVNAAGTALIYAGYIGGFAGEDGWDIAVDSGGNAYVTGYTNSIQATFPVTVGPDLTFNGSASFADAFVAKVNAGGTALSYAGYIGGSDEDEGRDIAVDSDGNAYITGFTKSSEATFPVAVGPDLTFNGGNFDAFVAKVNAAGTAFGYAGYIGGSGFEVGRGIAVDSGGNAYVTGVTTSTEATFPVAVGPDLTFNGVTEAFVAKVNVAGTALIYAGYIGGNITDDGEGIAVDSAGNAYITGYTNSTQATFPVTVGPDLTYNGGDTDAFVAKVNAAGAALIYAGYIGGSQCLDCFSDRGLGVAVDSAGSAYITGFTDATEASFPVKVGPDLTFNGGSRDAFVAKITDANTPQGTNVAVQPQDTSTSTSPVSLTFSSVTQAGSTTLTTSTTGPPPPSGFQLGSPPTYYEISTSATFTGSITVCIYYSGVSFSDESQLKLLHFEGGSWVDRTASLDTANDIICASVTSLSPFAIFESSNRPPVAECRDVTVSAGSDCMARAAINNGSFDPGGDPITLTQSPPGPYPLETTSVTLTVTDSNGASSSCMATVTVVDTTAPAVTSAVTQPSLWPPNHNLITVGLTASSNDNCTAPPSLQVLVFGDEDDEEPTGDGTHSPDARDIAPGTLRLRSERNGSGDGRVYLIVVKATDAAGNVGVSCGTVVVPKSQSKADKDSVNAQAASARSFCLANGGAAPPGYFVIGDGPVIGPKQ